MQMGEPAAVPVAPPPAEGEADDPALGETRQRRLGLAGERPFAEAAPAQGQLGRLDADQADLAAVAQDHRVAVDDLAHLAGIAPGQLRGPAGSGGRQHGHQGETDDVPEGGGRPPVSKRCIHAVCPLIRASA